MSEFLQTHVGKIKDGEILALISELEEACPVGSHQFVEFPLLFFLTQCVYPEGPTKRIPISTESCLDVSLLESRVGKLPDGPLRDLCSELALHAGSGLEFFGSSKVFMLLNKTLPKVEVKPPSASARWDAVIRQRRSNR